MELIPKSSKSAQDTNPQESLIVYAKDDFIFL